MSDIIKGLIKYVLPIILLFVTVKYLLQTQTDPDYKVENVLSDFIQFLTSLGDSNFFWKRLNTFINNTFIPLGAYIDQGNILEQILGYLGMISSALVVPFMLLYDIIVGIFTVVSNIFNFIAIP